MKLKLDQESTRRLYKLTGSQLYNFLGFTLDLEEGTLKDIIASTNNVSPEGIYIITTLLTHYSMATPMPPTGKLIKFKDLPGGCAYERAFDKRAIQPIAEVFGENKQSSAKLPHTSMASHCTTEMPQPKSPP